MEGFQWTKKVYSVVHCLVSSSWNMLNNKILLWKPLIFMTRIRLLVTDSYNVPADHSNCLENLIANMLWWFNAEWFQVTRLQWVIDASYRKEWFLLTCDWEMIFIVSMILSMWANCVYWFINRSSFKSGNDKNREKLKNSELKAEICFSCICALFSIRLDTFIVVSLWMIVLRSSIREMCCWTWV